ncbi:hypothetical protein ACFQS7_29825 [Dankookia sp. GCM10030260]|uniref:hypothetical protein n=1 Tax=Dankookia sp. GCM10030260 TaxID=3273390 RepID=UPI003622CF78
MHTMLRHALAGLALGLAASATMPAARAEGSESTSLQSVAEAMRQEAIQSDHSGWRNGEAKLTGSGTGSPGLTYSGAPFGGIGRPGAMIVGNTDGKPIVAYSDDAPSTTTRMASRR